MSHFDPPDADADDDDKDDDPCDTPLWTGSDGDDEQRASEGEGAEA